MAHVVISRHHRVGNRGEEVGGKMVRGVSGIGRTVGGLGFSERGRREAEYSGFILGLSRGIEIVAG